MAEQWVDHPDDGPWHQGATGNRALNEKQSLGAHREAPPITPQLLLSSSHLDHRFQLRFGGSAHQGQFSHREASHDQHHQKQTQTAAKEIAT